AQGIVSHAHPRPTRFPEQPASRGARSESRSTARATAPSRPRSSRSGRRRRIPAQISFTKVYRVQGSGFRVQGSFSVRGSTFKVRGSEFRVPNREPRTAHLERGTSNQEPRTQNPNEP